MISGIQALLYILTTVTIKCMDVSAFGNNCFKRPQHEMYQRMIQMTLCTRSHLQLQLVVDSLGYLFVLISLENLTPREKHSK